MLSQSDLISLVRSLIGSEHGAITVTQWAPISEHIVDTQYVFVTQEAAELFGYRDATDLEGQYLSQRHDPEDFERGAKLATARRLGMKIAPNAYTSRVLTASRTLRPVAKETNQLELNNSTYWITKLIPVENEVPIPNIDLNQMDIGGADLSRYHREFNVAMLERIIISGNKNLQYGLSSTILSQKTGTKKDQNMGRGTETVIDQNENLEPLVLYPGGSTELKKLGHGQLPLPWMHYCMVCGEVWRTKDPDPKQCGRRACRSFYWRTGVPEKFALKTGKARKGRKRLI